MVRAKEEIERAERVERERLAEENRTRSEVEKKQRDAEVRPSPPPNSNLDFGLNQRITYRY